MKYRVGIIIVSDRVSRGERKDETLPVFRRCLDSDRFVIQDWTVISDEPEAIRTALQRMIESEYELIFTTGGTGCAPRDNTPEVTRRLLDKPTPGLDEAIRAFSREAAPFAVFSRAVSGVAGKSFIVNLPGSPKAVAEILHFLQPLIIHPLQLINGTITDCVDKLKYHD
jgi:molybdenum cofactor synthesis domain-containing protein